jgi:hypothetical protein
MKSVAVKRDELLTILRTNLVTHVADYNKACEDYKATAVKELKELLKDAKKAEMGEEIELHVALAKPTSYADSYKLTIRMLEMATTEIVELSAQEFDSYVQDNWGWKQHFNAVNTSYMLSNKK